MITRDETLFDIRAACILLFLLYCVPFGLLAAVACRAAWKKYYLAAKAGCSLAFLAVFFAAYGLTQDREACLLMLPAFLCCLAGDILLAVYRSRKQKRYFILGLAVFLLGHVFFIRWMCESQRLTGADFVFPAAAVLLIWFLVSGEGWHTGKIRPLILLYTFFVSLLFSKGAHIALGTGGVQSWLAAAGGALFLLSDASILFLYFYKKPGKGIHLFNLITYYYAMFLLAVNPLFF